MLIERRNTGEIKDLEVVDTEPQSRKVVLRWPMYGYLEFCIDTGQGKGKAASQWFLTKESKAQAKKLLKERLQKREESIGSGNTSGR